MTKQLAFDFVAQPPAKPAAEITTPSPELLAPEAAAVQRPEARAPQKAALPRTVTLAPPPVDERPETLLGCVAWLQSQLGATHPEAKMVKGSVTTLLRVAYQARTLKDQDLPARPSELRQHLLNAMPAAINLSRSRFNNAKSLVTTLLIAVGWVSPDVRSRVPLGPFWSGRLSESGRQLPAGPLIPFFRHCEKKDIGPDAISGQVVEDYEAWCTEFTLDLRPRHTSNAITTSWRRFQRSRQDWPSQELRLPSRKQQKSLTASTFSAAFQSDLSGYLLALRDPDPLDPAQGRPLAEISLNRARRSMLRAATCLYQSGVPHEQILGIADLVSPQAFRAIAQALHTEGLPILRAAGERAQWTRAAYDIMCDLLIAARRWVKLADTEFAEIARLKARVKPRMRELSERVQANLADYLTDEERAELFDLPWRAFETADQMHDDKDAVRAAKLHEAALALVLALHTTLRLRDLARLDLNEHFARDRRGHITGLAIRSQKTSVPTRMAIDPEVARRITMHVEKFRQQIPGHETSSALFPSKGGKSRWPTTLGTKMSRLVARQLGKRFTAHLARHLAVDIALDADPRNMPIAQRQLGHRSLATTAKLYGSRATLAANKHYAQLVREQARRAGLGSQQDRRGAKHGKPRR